MPKTAVSNPSEAASQGQPPVTHVLWDVSLCQGLWSPWPVPGRDRFPPACRTLLACRRELRALKLCDMWTAMQVVGEIGRLGLDAQEHRQVLQNPFRGWKTGRPEEQIPQGGVTPSTPGTWDVLEIPTCPRAHPFPQINSPRPSPPPVRPPPAGFIRRTSALSLFPDMWFLPNPGNHQSH